MTVLFRILQFSYPLAIFIIAILYARKPFFLPMRFYMEMTFNTRARNLFRLLLAVFILVYNFSFTRTEPVTLWSAPGFLFGILLLHDGFTNAMLSRLHDDRILQLFALALFVFTLAWPELFQLSVSLVFTMMAAFLYPSRKIVEMAGNLSDYPEFNGTENDIVRHY